MPIPHFHFLPVARLAGGVGLALVLASAAAQSERVILSPAPGFEIGWDGNNGGYSSPDLGAPVPPNASGASEGTTTFASSSFQPGGIHDHVNVNDGYYGNSSSWIADFAADPPDTELYIGLAFNRTVELKSIAWGRDNGDATEPGCAGGMCTDRAVGVYTIQFTRAASPGPELGEGTDPTVNWVTLGTVEYTSGVDNAAFAAYLRHRFEVTQGGNPIPATGVRLKVSDAGIAIDELEVNPPEDPVPPLLNFLAITNTPGYVISWDLNDGAFSTPETPAAAPRNRALATTGTSAFGSSEFAEGSHFITNVNDGLYGNSHSWIPNFSAPDADPYIGLNFGGAIELRNIAWGRDNGDDSDCCGGELTDRALGLYTLQVTRVSNPDETTAESESPETGWVTVGQLDYRSAGAPFTPHKRHRFELSLENGAPIVATGIRLQVPDASTAIDEIEINAYPALETDLSANIAILPFEGFEITWDGNDGEFFSPDAGARTPAHDGLAATGAQAFGSSELDYGIHYIRNVADGRYGNASSWISDRGVGAGSDEDPFVGIAFGRVVELSVLAFGRDNGDTTEGGCGGTCLDRVLGIYTIQVTTLENPDATTIETGSASTGWETVGTIEYLAAAAPVFNPSRRHAFHLSRAGQPISATGVRIKVSDGNIAIDEIEVNPQTGVVAPPLSDLLAIQARTGFAITWDGNEGEYTGPESGAPARGNAALAIRGGVAIGSSELGLGTHFISSVNDGMYGNAHSWIPNADPADPDPWIGVRLPGLTPVRAVAWGRDNGDASDCCGGTLTDRSLGTYTLQFTHVPDPGTATPDTGDAATGWETVGTLEYKEALAGVFTPHLRHRFSVSREGGPVLATALRLKLSTHQLALDELEINPDPVIDQNVLAILPMEGFTITWDGSNGDFSTPASPALVPENEALASRGATAIGSSQLDLGVHFLANVNDGFYGNARSWIADFVNGDDNPWIGVAFETTIPVSSIAWGRDNGDTNDCCGGTLTDRAAGTYILQFTRIASPDAATEETEAPETGWATIGELQYRGGGTDAFRHHLRHEFKVAQNGSPIEATGIRLKLSSNEMAVDEIEVNTTPATAGGGGFSIRLSLVNGEASVEWAGSGVLESSEFVETGWMEVAGAESGYKLNLDGPRRFYRLRR